MKLAQEIALDLVGDGNSAPKSWERQVIREAVHKAQKRAAAVAAGWTGEVNTVENAGVVSEVCRRIAKEILSL